MSPEKFTDDKIVKLQEENLELRNKLQEAEEVLEAIRSGSVDALTIQGPQGPQIFTIKGADHTYRVLIEEMNEGALTLNDEAIILFSNSRFADFIQLPLENIIGRTFFDFLLPEDHRRFKKLFEHGWRKNSKGEFALQSENGKIMPFSLSMSALKVSESSSALGMIITDLSAEKEILEIKSTVDKQNEIISRKDKELQKEKQTNEEAERFRMVLEGIPQIAWTSSPEGTINYTNQFWNDYTGINPKQAINRGWVEALHPDDRAKTMEHFGQCLGSGKTVNIESRFKRANDNTYRWHLVRAMPVKNAEQQIILWVGTCTDIQYQKEYTDKITKAREDLSSLNEELNVKNEQLIRTNYDLDTFIYTASHDLKSPILNIEGLVKLLERRLQKDGIVQDQEQKLFQMITQSIDRFKNTIRDLTEVSKVQRNDEEETVEVVFEEMITDVKESLQDMIRDSNATIITDTIGCPSINMPRKNLRSIIHNLMNNAIKYHDPEREPVIYIKSEVREGICVMQVRDNGLGMDLSKGNKIFLMFKRLHNHVEGTGVGLYIVKRIIDNMGGKIVVESTPGEGTVFTIYFNGQLN